MSSENRFDQLFSASMLGGPYEQFRQTPPIGNRFITCGNAPYTGFYYAIDVGFLFKIAAKISADPCLSTGHIKCHLDRRCKSSGRQSHKCPNECCKVNFLRLSFAASYVLFNKLFILTRGWMGFNKTQATTKPKTKIEPSVSLPARYLRFSQLDTSPGR